MFARIEAERENVRQEQLRMGSAGAGAGAGGGVAGGGVAVGGVAAGGMFRRVEYMLTELDETRVTLGTPSGIRLMLSNQASLMGVFGSVRRRVNGMVQIVFEGTYEKVAAFDEWLEMLSTDGFWRDMLPKEDRSVQKISRTFRIERNESRNVVKGTKSPDGGDNLSKDSSNREV